MTEAPTALAAVLAAQAEALGDKTRVLKREGVGEATWDREAVPS
jgi:hypothetical protein